MHQQASVLHLVVSSLISDRINTDVCAERSSSQILSNSIPLPSIAEVQSEGLAANYFELHQIILNSSLLRDNILDYACYCPENQVRL